MSDDVASTTSPTIQPAPWPASTDRRGRLTWLLGLARKLIDYGKELATALRERGLTDRPVGASACFGTIDLALILSRIGAALLRAEALEARLLRSAARRDPEPRPPSAPSQRAPRAVRQQAEQAEVPDPDLARLPTAEQIAAEVRRKPVGVVLLDICRDLGITADHPLWRELNLAIIMHGGGLAAFFKDIWQRASATWREVASALAGPPVSSPPRSLQPACTGPP
jgi:hypothetical protein